MASAGVPAQPTMTALLLPPLGDPSSAVPGIYLCACRKTGLGTKKKVRSMARFALIIKNTLMLDSRTVLWGTMIDARLLFLGTVPTLDNEHKLPKLNAWPRGDQ